MRMLLFYFMPLLFVFLFLIAFMRFWRPYTFFLPSIHLYLALIDSPISLFSPFIICLLMCVCAFQQHGHVWHLETLVDDHWRHGPRAVDVGRRKHRGTRVWGLRCKHPLAHNQYE